MKCEIFFYNGAERNQMSEFSASKSYTVNTSVYFMQVYFKSVCFMHTSCEFELKSKVAY